MESFVHFVGGQCALLGGAYLLTRSFPWTVGVAVVLVAEGVISVVYGMLVQREAGVDKPWHASD